MSEQSRKEFEEWAKENLRCDLSHNGEHYNYADAYYAWEGWQASRQSLVVKLPELCDGENTCKCYYESQSIEDALDTAGVRYE